MSRKSRTGDHTRIKGRASLKSAPDLSLVRKVSPHVAKPSEIRSKARRRGSAPSLKANKKNSGRNEASDAEDSFNEEVMTVEQEKFAHKILKEFGMVKALLLCSSVFIDQWDAMSSLYVEVFSARRQALELARLCIKQEVSGTRQHLQLFREESLYISILRNYVQAVSIDYIRAAVQPIHQRGKNAKADFAKGALLKKLEAAPVPSALSEVMKYIADKTGRRFPRMTNPETFAVSFFFLRVLSPLITKPPGDWLPSQVKRRMSIQQSMRVCRDVQIAVNAWATNSRSAASSDLDKDHHLINSIAERLLSGASNDEEPPAHKDTSVTMEADLFCDFAQMVFRFEAPISHMQIPGSKEADVLKEYFGVRARHVVPTRNERKGSSDNETVRMAEIPLVFKKVFFEGDKALRVYFEGITKFGGQGTLSVFGERAVLVPAHCLVAGFGNEWPDSRHAPHLVYNFFRSLGAADCAHLRDMAAMEYELSAQKLAACVLMFMAGNGWGRFELLESGETAFLPDGGVSMLIRTRNSCCGESGCHSLRGYLGGWVAAASSREPIHCMEVVCSSSTHGCVFLAASSRALTSSKRRLQARFKEKKPSLVGALGEAPLLLQELTASARSLLTPSSSSSSSAKFDPSGRTINAGQVSPRGQQIFEFSAEPLNGTIHVLKERFVLVRARHFSGELWLSNVSQTASSVVIKSHDPEMGKLKNVPPDEWYLGAGIKHTIGQSMGSFGCSLLPDEEDLAGKIASLPLYFSQCGLGTLYVEPLSYLEPTLSAIFRANHAFEVDALTGADHVPQCTLIAGLLTGWCRAVTKEDVRAVELTCCSSSAQKHCTFLCTNNARIANESAVCLTTAGVPYAFSSMLNGLLKPPVASVSSTVTRADVSKRKPKKVSRFLSGFSATLKRGASMDAIQRELDEADKAEKVETAEEHDSSVASNAHRYLVVDDVESMLVMASHLLTQVDSGCTVQTINNGTDACSMALQGSFDLILMDLNMPGMDGATACQKIRLKDSSTPIYAMTSCTDQAVLDACIEKGMSGVLAKPFNKRRITEALEKLKLVLNQ